MKKLSKLLFFSFVLFIPILPLIPQTSPGNSLMVPPLGEIASTLEEAGLSLTITYAYYHDLDNDGYEDDILTVLQLDTVSGEMEFIYTNLVQAITTPSGITYYFVTTIIGVYDTLTLVAYWYDTATESGWYTFTASAESMSTTWYCQTYASYSFDPPDEGPEGGMPRVELFIG